MLATDLQRTADRWSNNDSWETPTGLYWMQLAAVQRRLNAMASGQADTSWVSHTISKHLAGRLPLARCLSLGCGTGALERQLAALGAFRACDACDIAEGALQKARAAARSGGYLGINYTASDLNTIELAAACYDAVWAFSSLHHVSDLEHVFSQVARSLKPGGLFILNEYVGPNRFQFAARQRQIIQACNDLLPPQYRRIVAASLHKEPLRRDAVGRRSLARRLLAKLRGRDLVQAAWRHVQRAAARQTGTRPRRDRVELPTPQSVTALDPSEAIRSADILSVLREHFDIVEFRPLGGGVLQFLLADIAGNFETAEGDRLLQMVFHIEDALMETGELASDFAYMVAIARGETR